MLNQAILLASYGTSAAVMAETGEILADELADEYKQPVCCCFYAEKYLKEQPLYSLEHQILRMKESGIQQIHAMLCFLSSGTTAVKMRESIHKASAGYFGVMDYGPILDSEELIAQLPQVLAESFGFSYNDQVLFVGHGSKTAADQSYQKVQRTFYDSGYKGVHMTLIRSSQSRINEMDPDKPVRLIPFLLGCGAHAKNEIFGDQNSIYSELNHKGYTVISEPTSLLELPAVRTLLAKIVFNVRREEN